MLTSDSLWSKVDHSEAEQLKRQKSACSKKLTPIAIDRDSGTGLFEGSSKDYKVSLERCECIDFARRKLPCKHMYRLAHELGCHDLTPFGAVASGSLKKDVPYTVDEIIARLSDEQAKLFQRIVYPVVYRHEPPSGRLPVGAQFDELEELGLLIILPDTPMTAASFYKIPILKEFLRQRNIMVKSTARRAEIVSLAVDAAADLIMDNLENVKKYHYYELNPLFEPIWGKLHHKLASLYAEESIWCG